MSSAKFFAFNDPATSVGILIFERSPGLISVSSFQD
jgi:hypothetical protein